MITATHNEVARILGYRNCINFLSTNEGKTRVLEFFYQLVKDRLKLKQSFINKGIMVNI